MFPGIHTAVETFNNLYSNLLALFGYDLDKQTIIVEKVKAFIGIIVHRTFVDIMRMHRYFEIADMWYLTDVLDK